MPARQNFNQRSKACALIGVGLLFCITATFAPSLQGANIERMGMIESTDHGATWQFKGHADFHAPALNPVDPSALFDKGLLAFYFFDLMSLSTDTAVAYRSVATDGGGLDFSSPAPAFKFAGAFTDPFVLKLPDGRYRMYVHGPTAILSATSNDGFTFDQDPGERTRAGGVPGALVLPDNKIRLFVCGQGITSLISDNGLDFTQEPGIRIPIPTGAAVVADPNPIRIADGTYRMAYKVGPPGQVGPPVLDEVHLAESKDGYSWTPGSASLVTGSVPTLVELPDGRLRIYYVDFQPDEPTGLFKFVKTVQVTPDAHFSSGGFVRINYVPATDRFAVTFGNTEGYAYKEYTTEMQETGQYGFFSRKVGDSGSRMIGNDYYFVIMNKNPDQPPGWRIVKYDAVDWETLDSLYLPLDYPKEQSGDPMVAYVDGRLDISGQYNATGSYPNLEDGAATFHYFFSTDLDSLDKKILADTPHIVGSSMIFSDGVYHFITADAFLGDVVMMKYDNDWKYLGVKTLVDSAHFSTGWATDGKRYYITYLNTSQRSESGGLPVHLNVHLAAFDQDWNLVEDLGVTNYTAADYKQPGRPWVIFHQNKLYVSFDLDSVDAATGEEHLKGQAIVAVYELMQGSTSVELAGRVLAEFRLEQNYPNPFNPSTTIRFDLPKAGRVRLAIYDLMGREIAVLVNEKRPQGAQEVRWDGRDSRHAQVPSGVYLYRVEAGPYHATGKLLLLR